MTSPIQLSDVYRDRYYENQGLPELVTLIAPTERRVLDIGCGAGGNLRLLSARGYDPVGVTLSLSEARACREQGFDCHVADLSVGLPFGAGAFDAVILSHVLEHMPWPEAALAAALANVRSGGGVYVAVPNALFLPERLRFLRGQFRYTETGIMDRTHLRFFDFASVRRLLEVVGVTVTAHFGVGFVPQRPLRRLAPQVAARVDRWGVRHWPSLFAFHIVAAGRVP